jgi:hypothetical protein
MVTKIIPAPALASSAESIEQTVERLMRKNARDGFSKAQLTRAVTLFLERYPGSQIESLHPEQTWPRTYLRVNCAETQARAFCGTRFVPRGKKRVWTWTPAAPTWLEWVRRLKGGRMMVAASIADGLTDGTGADFTPSAIRAMAPQAGPEDAPAWKTLVRDRLQQLLDLPQGQLLEPLLRQPVFPVPYPGKDRFQEVSRGLNSRFSLDENAVQSMLAVFSRHQRELAEELMHTLEGAAVRDARNPSVRLVVDNGSRTEG